jgi:hypothetical protein
MFRAFVIVFAIVTVTACAVEPTTSSLAAASTTCVSDPIVADGDGDNLAPRCPPPPTPAQRTQNWIQAPDHYPGATYLSALACHANDQQIACAVNIVWNGSRLAIGCALYPDGTAECWATIYPCGDEC